MFATWHHPGLTTAKENRPGSDTLSSLRACDASSVTVCNLPAAKGLAFLYGSFYKATHGIVLIVEYRNSVQVNVMRFQNLKNRNYKNKYNNQKPPMVVIYMQGGPVRGVDREPVLLVRVA